MYHTLRTLLLILFGLAFTQLCAQIETDFGQLSIPERYFQHFESDTAAAAVYLYEKGDHYFEIDSDRIYLFKKYRAKIKILKESALHFATVEVPYYKGEKSSEKVIEIRAITHNDTQKTGLKQEDIYNKDLTPRWSVKTFTFPNAKVGSILEYAYTVRSPFFYNFQGWEFQAEIPKVYTEFNARIPGNYRYNRAMMGYLQLDVNDARIEKACLRHPALREPADCEVLKYIMKNVPAFKEEPYMLAASNYKSRIEFEMSEHQSFNGEIHRYTKSWRDVDTEFRKDSDIGRQLTKKNFFERNVPESLLVEGSPIERAQNIHKFVKDHFVWNGEYGIYQNSRVKEAFEKGSGNVGEINMSLINLLNAADIPAQLVLCATRSKGLPKKTHPVLADFNYVLARIELNGKRYYLDATDKFIPFGMLPEHCLNYYGRVMSLKEASYWEDFESETNNLISIRSQMQLDGESGQTKGTFYTVSSGYPGVDKHKEINSMGKEAYLEELSNRSGGALTIASHNLDLEKSNESRVFERFECKTNVSKTGNLIYLNPFFIAFFKTNPFTSESRSFPVDFAYARRYSFSMKLDIPEGYEVESIPKPVAIGLPENAASLRFNATQTPSSITVTFTLNLAESYYAAPYYEGLKKIFQKAAEVQKNTLLVLKKT